MKVVLNGSIGRSHQRFVAHYDGVLGVVEFQMLARLRPSTATSDYLIDCGILHYTMVQLIIFICAWILYFIQPCLADEELQSEMDMDGLKRLCLSTIRWT